MKFDFPIESVKFKFKRHGTAQINLRANNKDPIYLDPDYLEIKVDDNPLNVSLRFTKETPDDQKSYVELKSLLVNEFDFTDMFKHIPYTIDKKQHPDAPNKIPNNLYFGYTGKMDFTIEHKTDLLTKAAWTIANNDFEYIKVGFKGENYRKKTLHNILRDTKYMFVGCVAPNCKEITDSINGLSFSNLRLPMKKDDMFDIQNWINNSNRIQLENFDQLPYFNYANGVTECLNTFINSSDTIYMPKKMFYFHIEMLQNKNIVVKDIFKDELETNSKVIFELPSPWYDTLSIMEKIKKAKSRNCEVALDLTWIPTSKDLITLDLTMVDQIFFSMNKTWPIQDFRPAFRWSKARVHDSITFQWEHCFYQKIAANVFLNLIKQYPFDYTYNKYKQLSYDIENFFGLQPTNILWFTKHKDFKHSSIQLVLPGYFLDDFVCCLLYTSDAADE